MEQGPSGLMTPFDSLTTTKQLQMIKLMLPFTPASSRPMLAVFIKFQELQNTIRIFKDTDSRKFLKEFEKKIDSPMDMIEEIRPFMKEEERASMDMMMTAFNMMDMMNMASGSSDGNIDPMDMMKGMLTPDQQEAFNSYNTMFAAEFDTSTPDNDPKEAATDTDSTKKGDDNIE